ncbi:putative mediator of RNA polymerase II transcription subunit 15 [Drosophila obscura]|uniref:putative mediator of RNA polymerase II transcription subunit 15 n=1 Tax=Drosophila obscura TaxID=7282 RepID=UPI001BB1AAC0|nr:putative mediator of RNA polymerase II transcription subunit 15 [Drosophila obscura]
MSHGEDVLDNWEELDEAGLSMTLQTKLQTSEEKPVIKMKLLQRPQSLQDSSGNPSSVGGGSPAPRQITIAKKPSPPEAQLDGEPVMMVLHKSTNDYDPATYATPTINQTVKILRRPAQAEERRDTNGMKPKQPIKTLKQREQEYAEARLRILGAAKNPEDDKPPTPPTPPGGSLLATPQTAPPAGTHSTLPAVSYNNNNNNNNSNPGPGPGMHRSSSAPKMSQVSAMYNNYNSYFQGPHNPGLNYYYQHAGPLPPQQQPPVMQPHFNQRMPPYGVGGGMGMGGMPAQSPPQSSLNQQQQQQSWSPVVGGSVSAALLRQQSMQQSPQQHQQQHQPPQTYNDNVLRLPRGPCPNGSVGFQMRR